MGPVNDSARARGFFAHTALAISVEEHEVLGVLDQHVWARAEGEGNQRRVVHDQEETQSRKRTLAGGSAPHRRAFLQHGGSTSFDRGF
jgi:hypothetical protein